MASYEYPIITGYWWNAIQKISIALGINMDDISISSTGTKTFVNLNMDLNSEQKAIVDDIMANHPCAPDLSNDVTFRINDLWGMRKWYSEQMGLAPIFWFTEGQSDGSGECYIYMTFKSPLTDSEKEKIISTYKSTIVEMGV